MRLLLHARRSGLVVLALILAGTSACEPLLHGPAPGPGTLALTLAPTGPDFAVAPAASNRVRVQVRDGSTVLLDSVFPFNAKQEEVFVPVRFSSPEAAVAILVEIGADGRPLLRGSTEVRLRRMRVTEAEVRLHGAEALPLTPASDLATGIYHSCALTERAGILCWGYNEKGQAGADGTPLSLLPIEVEGTRSFAEVDAGLLVTCATTFQGAVYCWGSNQFGGLGSGGSPARSADPVRVDAKGAFDAVSVGGLHACALSVTGRAYCWGHNGFGQLGDGTTTDRSSPVPVATEATFRSISAGYTHTCGVTTAGQALCWGLNEFGQLGNGGTDDRLAPWPVLSQRRFMSVSAGGLHSCGVAENGEAFCWGFNDFGQLGTESTGDETAPVSVGEQRFTGISAGGVHTCAVSDAGSGYCWGHNGSGALGDGTRENRSSPTRVAVGDRFGLIRSGLHHSCGTLEEGRVVCWGYNRFAQLGDGSRINRDRPTDVLRADPFFSEGPIAGGGESSIAALREGRIVISTEEESAATTSSGEAHMRWNPVRGVMLALMLLPLAATGLSAQGADTRPGVAVFPFTNGGSFGPDREDLAPLEVGIQQLVLTELAQNGGLRVVERSQLRAILDEQGLVRTGQVDPSTAARIGRLVGARYAITGVFMDLFGNFRLDGRIINVETGEVMQPVELRNRKENLYEMLVDFASQITDGIDLPPLEVALVQQRRSREIPPEAVTMFSRAQVFQDGGRQEQAIELYRQIAERFPEMTEAKEALRQLTGS